MTQSSDLPLFRFELLLNAGGKPSHWDFNSESHKGNFSHKAWLLHVLSKGCPIHGICGRQAKLKMSPMHGG